VGEIFLDGKLDRANLPDGLNKQDFDVLNVRNISVFSKGSIVISESGLELSSWLVK
jgi:hypothetical protein